jgi:aminoglycoside phosphotransferase (APT) family kinase protein
MRLPRVLEADRATLRAAPWTVVHADLHAENVLFGEGGTPAILDWTDTGRGPAAVDVAHLLVEGMTIETRRSAADAYLCAYADALGRAGVGRDASQLRAEVACVHRVLFAAAILWSLGPHRPPPDVPRVAKIIQNLLDNTVAAVADALDEH